VDLVALVAFVVIGRASHHHGETLSGFVSTAWPFAVGILAGWLVSTRRALSAARTGAVVCVVTVAVGMVLRVVAGQGTAVAFVVVALVFLGAVMILGRLVVERLARPDRRRGAPVRQARPQAS
jgi:peptidoglycan/LPS O-acetylase OafA/YrhL